MGCSGCDTIVYHDAVPPNLEHLIWSDSVFPHNYLVLLNVLNLPNPTPKKKNYAYLIQEDDMSDETNKSSPIKTHIHKHVQKMKS